MKKLFKINIQFFADSTSEPAPASGNAPDPTPGPEPTPLDAVIRSYEGQIAALERERDLAKAETLEHKKAIDVLLNGRKSNPAATDSEKFLGRFKNI